MVSVGGAVVSEDTFVELVFLAHVSHIAASVPRMTSPVEVALMCSSSRMVPSSRQMSKARARPWVRVDRLQAWQVRLLTTSWPNVLSTESSMPARTHSSDTAYRSPLMNSCRSPAIPVVAKRAVLGCVWSALINSSELTGAFDLHIAMNSLRSAHVTLQDGSVVLMTAATKLGVLASCWMPVLI
jgi:hypothetical protein